MRTKMLRIRLTDQEWTDLERVSTRAGRSMSEYTRRKLFDNNPSGDIITEMRNASAVFESVEVYVDILVDAAKSGDSAKIAEALEPFGHTGEAI